MTCNKIVFAFDEIVAENEYAKHCWCNLQSVFSLVSISILAVCGEFNSQSENRETHINLCERFDNALLLWKLFHFSGSRFAEVKLILIFIVMALDWMWIASGIVIHTLYGSTHLWCMCLPRLYVIRMQLHVNAFYLMLPRATIPPNVFAQSKCNIDTIEMVSKLNQLNSSTKRDGKKKWCDWTAFAFYLAHDTMPLPMTWSIWSFVWGKRMRMEPCLYQYTWQGFKYKISQDIVYSIVWWDLKYTPKRTATTSTTALEKLIWSETWFHLSVNDYTTANNIIYLIFVDARKCAPKRKHSWEFVWMKFACISICHISFVRNSSCESVRFILSMGNAFFLWSILKFRYNALGGWTWIKPFNFWILLGSFGRIAVFSTFVLGVFRAVYRI